MNSKPRVSIGMPVHNGDRYLRDALDSLLAQDYGNFELIISDNASTDATGEICREFASKDKRISYLRKDCKVEVFANFRLVLDKARGVYFMWAAADDRWLPGFVSALVAELNLHPEAGVAMCGVERIREDGTLLDYVRCPEVINSHAMRQFTLAMALASGRPYHLYFYGLFRTDFIRRAFTGFPMVVLGDRLFVCGLALATDFRYVDQILYIRRGHDQSIADRYVGEELGRIWTDRFGYIKLVANVGPYLMWSRIIPWQRKFFIPILVLKFAWMHRKRIRRAILGWLFPTLLRPRRRKVRQMDRADTT